MDASHEKFRGLYMDTLKKELKSKGRKLDYVVVSHTEPDHSGEPALPLAAWTAEPHIFLHCPPISAWAGPFCELQTGRLTTFWVKPGMSLTVVGINPLGQQNACM